MCYCYHPILKANLPRLQGHTDCIWTHVKEQHILACTAGACMKQIQHDKVQLNDWQLHSMTGNCKPVQLHSSWVNWCCSLHTTWEGTTWEGQWLRLDWAALDLHLSIFSNHMNYIQSCEEAVSACIRAGSCNVSKFSCHEMINCCTACQGYVAA